MENFFLHQVHYKFMTLKEDFVMQEDHMCTKCYFLLILCIRLLPYTWLHFCHSTHTALVFVNRVIVCVVLVLSHVIWKEENFSVDMGQVGHKTVYHTYTIHVDTKYTLHYDIFDAL